MAEYFNGNEGAILRGGDDADYMENVGDNSAIYGNGGNDTISNKASSVLIYGGTGNDSIEAEIYKVTIEGGTGNDTIIATNSSTIRGNDGDDYITAGKNSSVLGDGGKDTIYLNSGENSYAYGGADDDSISGNSDKITLDGGAGNDTLHCGHSDYSTIIGNDGEDFIEIDYNVTNSKIESGNGNDTISWLYSYDTQGVTSTISSGDGNDYIEVEVGGITLSGDNGNDTIESKWLGRTTGNLIQYTLGDGNDTIKGFNSSIDTLQVVSTTYSTVSTQTSSQAAENLTDVLFSVEGGSITLKDLKISDIESNPLKVIGTNSSGNSTRYTYTGGNMTISEYAGEKIIYATDYQGIGFNTTDFMLNSSSGTLTVKNVHNKVLDIVTEESGGTVAYVYWTTNDGKIDGSGISAFELVIGGDNLSNEILAGSGGSSLWGGVGGYDTLTGGNGIDNFFYGKSDGIDTINSASRYDTILLYDINLNDISEVSYGTNQINLNLFSGGKLQVNGTENFSAVFQLADGSKYKCDTNTQTWQTA